MTICFLLSACATKSPTPAGWTPRNPWGELSATPGARLTYVETSRTSLPQGTGVTYKLQAYGLPKEKTYSLWGRWIDGRTVVMYNSLHIDDSNRILRQNGAELEFGLKHMFEGESMNYALISDDKSNMAFIEVTPFPIKAKGTGSCRLSVKLVSPAGQIFLIEGGGFEPRQEIHVVAQSNGETGGFQLRGTVDGTFIHGILPAIKGKTGGLSTFTASDRSCSVTVRFHWGDAIKKK